MLGRVWRVTLAIGVVAAPAVVALPPGTGVAAAADEPTVEVWTAAADGTRLDGDKRTLKVAGDQTVEVRWKGFRPNSRVVLTQCLSAFHLKNVYSSQIPNPAWNSVNDCAHQTRLYAATGEDGSGKASYPVKSGRFASVVLSADSVNQFKNRDFECTSRAFGAGEYTCSIVVAECEWDQAIAMERRPAGTGPFTLVPRTAAAGVADQAVAAASGQLWFRPGPDGLPVSAEVPAPPPRKIPGPPQAPPLPPITGTPEGAPAAGAGSVNTGWVLDDWLAGVRRLDKPSDVDFTRGTSQFGATQLKAGFQSGFTAGADFAVTGVPYSAAEAGGQIVYAPITLTALAVANSAEYGGLGLNELRMSPDTLAFMLAGGDGVDTAWWGDTLRRSPTSADNGGCGLPALPAGPILRSGQSAQNGLLSAWFAAALPRARFDTFFVSEPGSPELLPKRAADTRSSENGAQTAYLIGTNFGKALDPDPDDDFVPPVAIAEKQKMGYLGYTDVTEISSLREQDVSLPVAALRNPAGKYVLPGKESILAAYAAMRHNSDGTLTALFDQRDEAAYPLPMVHYIAVPRTDAQGRNPLPIAKRKTVASFIEYSVSDAAQARVEELGGAPLPERLRKQARDVAAMLRRADPPAKPSPSPSSNSVAQPGGGGGGGLGSSSGAGGSNGSGGTGASPVNSASPRASAAPAPLVVPAANEGSVRGGKIPSAAGALSIILLLVLGGGAVTAGGVWRGYLVWRGRSEPAAERS